MCGIAGIIGRPDADAALARMRIALRHRGPDGEGSWRSEAGDAQLAHTRLAVIDPTPAAGQPMTTDDGRLTIVFSGEIYNYRELRAELEGRATFRTRSDTEVLLHGLRVHGARFVRRLRGMFAFAAWNDDERACLLGRDTFGLKPLYFHHADDGTLVFASELRALLASGLVPRELDPRGLQGYLRTGTVPEPLTLMRRACCVEAGHVVEWRDRKIRREQYRDVRFAPDAGSNHHAERTREALADTVRHHLISDVPVGLLLSGGMDSAALLALASASGIAPVRTFSLALPGSPADESALARQSADRFGADHAELPMDASSARELFPAYLAAIDQPSIDGFNTYVVSRFARERGVKVVLSGVGADELFGGYASFDRIPRLTSWNARLARAGALRGIGGRVLESLTPDARWRRVGDLLQQPATLAHTHTVFRGIFTRRESQRIAAHFGVRTAMDEGISCEGAAQPDIADEISRLELTRYVRNQLARDSDAASMACGVELRAPFLDGPLFDTLSRIPASIRLASAKRLLRQAVPELPPWVDGPKRCFQFPFDEWASREWRGVFAGADAHSPVPLGTWYRKLSIVVLTDWMEKMNSHVR